ncbi:Phox-like protein [Venustampulla echinocandica]|uniref:Endosomal/vacuolar adapter protein YPT35 n=1 Tax=Venustampulla echinocandica TaxID=2656787 RepID=A0A370TEK3_9HELO|nr:Phox-like protein [Venustampulla echinocandica]RDL33127.1 Phox-like protein [Venustampulla echinocandica]
MEGIISHESAGIREFRFPPGQQRSSSSSDDANNDETSPISPVTSPPYWMQSHQRSVSNISIESIPRGAITLQDNTDGEDVKNKACWAKSVYIEGHVVVNGNRTGIGSFVVWNINVETLRGGTMRIRKRYSEFDDLRYRLLKTFPNSEAAMPPLPPKSVISKFRPKFLETRRAGLQYFLNCILLNPEFSGSPALKEFLFS